MLYPCWRPSWSGCGSGCAAAAASTCPGICSSRRVGPSPSCQPRPWRYSLPASQLPVTFLRGSRASAVHLDPTALLVETTASSRPPLAPEAPECCVYPERQESRSRCSGRNSRAALRKKLRAARILISGRERLRANANEAPLPWLRQQKSLGGVENTHTELCGGTELSRRPSHDQDPLPVKYLHRPATEKVTSDTLGGSFTQRSGGKQGRRVPQDPDPLAGVILVLPPSQVKLLPLAKKKKRHGREGQPIRRGGKSQPITA